MPQPEMLVKPSTARGGRSGRLRVALISISHCPSLATRNLRRYCLADDDVRSGVEFVLIDRDLREFLQVQVRNVRQLSFVTTADEILVSLLSLEPAIVAFSCYLWNTELVIRLATQIKALLPQSQIVLGGPDVGPRAEALLERHPDLDVIVDGDGEVPFLELVRRHLAGRPAALVDVPQVIFRDRGAVVRSVAPNSTLDLARLSDVWAEDLPAADELRRWSFPNLLYETMRGCPYPCSYCMYGRTPTSEKDVETVVDELAVLLGRGLSVELIDPTFTTRAPRAKAILRGLAGRAYSGRLWFEAYPDSIDEELVDLMTRTNVCGVGIGFQTLSADGLKAVKRPRNLVRFERAVRLLRAGRITFWVDVIYGLPNTTVADFMATMDYLHTLGATLFDMYRLLGLPGSPMMRDTGTYGLVFSASPPYELLSSRTFSIEDIFFCDRFVKTYDYLRAYASAELIGRLARLAGGLSALVRFVMDSGIVLEGEDAGVLSHALAGLMARGCSPAVGAGTAAGDSRRSATLHAHRAGGQSG